MGVTSTKCKHRIIILIVWSVAVTASISPGQTFFREHWAEFDRVTHNNPNGNRWRVNDADLSLHEIFGLRSEALANGLVLINVPEDLFQLDRAELYLELWGGHPLTEHKRFMLNGKGKYVMPDDGVAADQCNYTYPAMAVTLSHLVRGVNAIQFACDRGQAFWGHYIIDQAAVRCRLKPNHPDLIAAGLRNFTAEVKVEHGPVLFDQTRLSLAFPTAHQGDIESVCYEGRYLDYDDNGNGLEADWHGYTQARQVKNHIGTATEPPFAVVWDTRFVPTQARPMAVRARVTLKNGIQYQTQTTDGLLFPPDRKQVTLFTCTDMPRPFWSRDNQEKKAVMLLPPDLSQVESARLYVRIWDGGEGDVKAPFQINGHAYAITSGKAIHDVVFTIADVNPEHLKPGENVIALLSDTEHHGIEMLLPGPALILRFQ